MPVTAPLCNCWAEKQYWGLPDFAVLVVVIVALPISLRHAALAISAIFDVRLILTLRLPPAGTSHTACPNLA
jgi:hypothetical protein